jgi:hypothetical protein
MRTKTTKRRSQKLKLCTTMYKAWSYKWCYKMIVKWCYQHVFLE